MKVALLVAVASCEEECDPAGPGGSTCCKVCTDSKPCGDSCIANNQTCSKYGGCACSGLAE